MAIRYAYLMSIEITSDNQWFDTSWGNYSIATGTYEDIRAVLVALNTQTMGSPVLAFGTEGQITISEASTFTLDWATGPHSSQSIGSVLGFDTSADDTGASAYVSDYQIPDGWYSDQGPEFDSYDLPIVRGGKLHIAQSSLTKRVTNPGRFYERQIDLGKIALTKWHPDFSATNEAFTDFFDEVARGRETIIYTDTSPYTRAGKYVLLSPDSSLLRASTRMGPDAAYFDVPMRWHRVSA